jgi:hypothetical protein
VWLLTDHGASEVRQGRMTLVKQHALYPLLTPSNCCDFLLMA